MSFTSSEIQKKLERGAFSIHIARKHIEALKAEIAGHEEQMYDTARSLYDNEGLVEAAIAMAQMSIPALEMRASKIVAGNNQSSVSSTSREDALTQLIDASVDAVTPASLDADSAAAEEDSTPTETSVDGPGLTKIYTEEFFGVEVPVSQFDLAREIKHEAAVSVKQNTKSNIYASDRGKNAWRKALFARARAEYLKNGIPTDGSDIAPAVDTPDVAAVDTVSDVVEDVSTDAAPVSEQMSEAAETFDDAATSDDGDVHANIVLVQSDVEGDHVVEQLEVEELETASDAQNIDADEWSVDRSDDLGVDAQSEISEQETSGVIDIPFFDDPVTDVLVEGSDDMADVVSEETTLPVSDDHTLSIADTYFPDDDIPVLDPITFDDENSEQGFHDDPVDVADQEDIDIPDFDPDAELFDGDTAADTNIDNAVTSVPERPTDVTSVPVDATRIEEPAQTSTEVNPRAVSISSLPAHQRPGAPRAPSPVPSRPQPAGAPGRVVTIPTPPPAQSTSREQAAESAPKPAAPSVGPSPPSRVVTPSAPSRAAPPRAAPARTHGFGAKVPAPPGFDDSIRERDAAETKPVAQVPTPSRPGSAPVRPGPGAARGPVFTKPTFSR
jgi:hypothetical protein